MADTQPPLDDPTNLAEALGSDALWRDLFDAAPVPYALYHLASGRLFGNDAYCAQLGYTRDELSALDPASILDPEETEGATEAYRGLLDGSGPPARPAKRYVRKDGSRFWGEAVVSTLRDHGGHAWALLSCVQDVTARVEAEHALRVRDERLRALLQNAADAVILLDADFVISYASPPAARMLRMRSADLVGAAAFDFVHPEDQAVVIEAVVGTPRPPEVGQPTRFRVVSPTGEVRSVEAIGTDLRDDPAIEGFVINIRDITDNQEVIDALAVIENRYRKMLENISDVVVLVDADGRILASAGNVSSILGYGSDFWEGRTVFEIVHPDDIDPESRLLTRLLAEPGGTARGEFRALAADGSWVDVEVDAVNLLHDPSVEAIVVTTRDISDRKRGERELATARDQAVQALAARTEFIASVSHELRTPVHGILGLTELLTSSPGLDEATRELARSVGRATESLRMVLDDILDFSKIEVGRLEIDRRPVRLDEIVRDVVALFAPQAAAKSIGLDASIDPEVPAWVMLDELRVRQVLSNLVANAVKFTAEGGVHVTVERVDGQGAPVARIGVADTGIGISEDEQAALFEPFSQAHRSTAREFGGTGLGLSIARRLVELMGGELDLESEPGRGSLFWFCLPVVPADGPVEEGRLVVRRRPGAVPRVLVVEDNPINQLLVTRQLERMGCDAVVVDGGLRALASFDDVDPDVVLMDWQLPDLDGLETTRRLRAHENAAGRSPVPVIAMTASALPGDRARCLEAGMDDFLAKPVGMATLRRAVARWTAGVDEASTSSSTAGAPPRDTDVETAPGDTSWAPTPRSASSGAVDPLVLDQLVDELGDPGVVVTVIRTYLRELDGRVATVAAAIEANDHQRLGAALHTLKSTSAAVGADQLSEWSRRTEQLAAVTSAAPPGASTPMLRAQAKAVRQALEAEIRRLEGADPPV